MKCENYGNGNHKQTKESPDKGQQQTSITAGYRPEISAHFIKTELLFTELLRTILKAGLRPFIHETMMAKPPLSYYYGRRVLDLPNFLSGTLPNKTLLVTKVTVRTQCERLQEL